MEIRFMKRVRECTIAWHNLLKTNLNEKPTKIKLVAIAKNEAAYLPEWIFHHLHFGFDCIEIHINNSTDNTNELLNNLALLKQVKFVNADYIFNNPTIKFPQMHVYRQALIEGKTESFTHIMFLDIDEFWLPKNFSTSIYECVKKLKGDVISFEWLLKYDESTPFGPAITPSLLGKKSAQLKSIVKTGMQISFASPHNMVVKNGSNILADGSTLHASKENFSIAPDFDEMAPIKDFFILHRMLRSEEEYVAMLGTTIPFKRPGFNSTFKDNRFGYDTSDASIEVPLPQMEVQHYNDNYEEFKREFNLLETHKKAVSFVMERKKAVIKKIETAPLKEHKILRKILRNVRDKQTQAAWELFKSRHNLPL